MHALSPALFPAAAAAAHLLFAIATCFALLPQQRSGGKMSLGIGSTLFVLIFINKHMQEKAFSVRSQEGALQQQGTVQNGNKEEEAKRQAEQQEMAKNSILTQIIDKEGMSRLSNLRAAKPEKARAVEGMLIEMARSGRIRGRMSDSELRTLLDRVSAAGGTKSTKVKYDRRRAAIDSDEELDKMDEKRASSTDDDD
ncbi:hypothetical protein niasHS_011112 [Heterodera schachtii]|uniref:Programmed cell death protein 5 n=1 Tax=Heterodera schachtii TaxID=97005 RepID=A0ABD2J132_HETSC